MIMIRNFILILGFACFSSLISMEGLNDSDGLDYSDSNTIFHVPESETTTDKEAIDEAADKSDTDVSMSDTSHNEHIWQCSYVQPTVGPIKQIEYNGRGDKILVTGIQSNKAEIWDVHGSKHVCSLVGHKAAILCAAFHPTKNRVITGAADCTAKIWDAKTGKCLYTLQQSRVHNHHFPVTAVALSATDDLVLTGSNQGKTIVWQYSSHKNRWNPSPPLENNGNSTSVVNAVCFNGLNDMIFVALANGTLRSYFLKDKRWLAGSGYTYSAPITTIKVLPGNKFICIQFDVDHNEELNYCLLALQGHDLIRHDLALTPENIENLENPKKFLTFDHTGNSFISKARSYFVGWALSDKKECDTFVYALEHNKNANASCAAYSQQDNAILTASDNGLVKLWVKWQGTWAVSDTLMHTDNMGNPQSADLVLFNPVFDEMVLTANLSAGTIKLWRIKAQADTVKKNKRKNDQENTQKSAKPKKAKKASEINPVDALVDAILHTKSDKRLMRIINKFEGNLNQLDSTGQTPLFVASFCNKAVIVEHLIARGANVNYPPDANAFTSLHIACEKGFKDVVQVLLSHDAHIDRTTQEGKSALTFALENNHAEVAQLLLDNGADELLGANHKN